MTLTFFENLCFSFGLIDTCFDFPKQEIFTGDGPCLLGFLLRPVPFRWNFLKFPIYRGVDSSDSPIFLSRNRILSAFLGEVYNDKLNDNHDVIGLKAF